MSETLPYLGTPVHHWSGAISHILGTSTGVHDSLGQIPLTGTSLH